MNAVEVEPYTIEDFLDDVMRVAREKIDEIDHLHPAQRVVVWEHLKRDIDAEKDA
jgi:hypothetical protein